MNRNFLEKDIKLSIVILTYNRKDKVSRCIDSCLESNINCKYEIIVIDNHSTDGTKKIIESKYLKRIKYYYMDDNLGVPQGRNEGFIRTKGEFVLFLDDDIYFKDHNDIDKLLETKMVNDKAAIITTKIFDVIENELIPVLESKEKNEGNLVNVLSFHGAIHIIKKIDFKDGLYDSKVKFGCEDLLLSMQVVDRGFRVVCDNSIMIMHDHPRMFCGRVPVALKSLLYTKKTVYPTVFYPIIMFMHYLRCFKHFGFNLKQIKDVTNIDIVIKSDDKIAFKTVFKLLKEYPFAKIF